MPKNVESSLAVTNREAKPANSIRCDLNLYLVFLGACRVCFCTQNTFSL